jgi:hypothetical protein
LPTSRICQMEGKVRRSHHIHKGGDDQIPGQPIPLCQWIEEAL